MSKEKLYRLEVRPEKKLILVHTTGSWDAETVLNFTEEVVKLIKAQRFSDGFYMLYNSLQGKVMQAEAGEKILETSNVIKKLGVKKTAVVLSSAVLKMQANRLINQGQMADTTRNFDNEEEALSWLFQD